RAVEQAGAVRAALRLPVEVGFDALTGRRRAARLGVKPAPLSRHIRDKGELLVLLADEISGEIPLPSTSGSWRDRFVEAAWNVRRGLRAHRDGARVLASTAPFGPRRPRPDAASVGVLRAAGLRDPDATGLSDQAHT